MEKRGSLCSSCERVCVNKLRTHLHPHPHPAPVSEEPFTGRGHGPEKQVRASVRVRARGRVKRVAETENRYILAFPPRTGGLVLRNLRKHALARARTHAARPSLNSVSPVSNKLARRSDWPRPFTCSFPATPSCSNTLAQAVTTCFCLDSVVVPRVPAVVRMRGGDPSNRVFTGLRAFQNCAPPGHHGDRCCACPWRG